MTSACASPTEIPRCSAIVLNVQPPKRCISRAMRVLRHRSNKTFSSESGLSEIRVPAFYLSESIGTRNRTW